MTISLSTYLAYPDAKVAIDWLERALGFETTMAWPDEQGRIQHAELRLGDAALMVFDDAGAGYTRPERRGETSGAGVYLTVPDEATVDAMFARAEEAGSEVVWTPGATEWGNYRARVVDPGGREWTVGTHRPGEPQGDWSDDSN